MSGISKAKNFCSTDEALVNFYATSLDKAQNYLSNLLGTWTVVVV